MKVLNAMDPIHRIHSERYTIKTLLADYAGEAARVVRFARCAQDTVQDGVSAYAALL